MLTSEVSRENGKEIIHGDLKQCLGLKILLQALESP